jgi:hypothetical protein
MRIQPGYEFKGVKYLPDYDYEEDNMKIFHLVETDKGTLPLDWSPYSIPTIEEFQTWVNLGMPRRIGTGPLTREDLLKILQGQHV